METIDIGERLVELGFAKAVVPSNIEKNSIESKLAPVILSAEARAKNYREGIWSDNLPPLPIYIVYWRKGSKITREVVAITAKKLFHLLKIASVSFLGGAKKLALRPFKPTVKQVQTT